MTFGQPRYDRLGQPLSGVSHGYLLYGHVYFDQTTSIKYDKRLFASVEEMISYRNAVVSPLHEVWH